MTLENELFDIPSEHVQNVYGQFDAYLKKIERTIGVTVVSRDGSRSWRFHETDWK